jgi:type 1 glutamine amidotransferase
MLKSAPLCLGLWLASLAIAAEPDTLMPHRAELAAGVHAVGFADQFRSANCGWVTTADTTVLVDLPRGIAAAEYLDAVKRGSDKPATSLVLTHAAVDDAAMVAELRRLGVKQVYLSPATHKALTARADAPVAADGFELVTTRRRIGAADLGIELVPLDETHERGAMAVYVPRARTLFAGPLVVHGPRVALPHSDTAAWVAAISRLESLGASRVVPGFGSWEGLGKLERQRRFLAELRRQVAYFIAKGRPREELHHDIALVSDYLVWMPYDTPIAEDVEHVYGELTVPHAPFRGRPPAADDKRAHALVLIGDEPHEPGHIEAGLRPVFEATGVVPHFTVDVRALSADNLAHVKLLVMLRDGLLRPHVPGQKDFVWMTPEQEQAVVEFVHRGGAFLNLHNAMGLYPENGPFLNLVGGRYIGHGPLERFRVEVVDRDHPVTRGVANFSLADEQHTPPCDETKVHVLLRNRSDSGQMAAAGWVYEPGQGRLCHLANGHTRESLLHPMYQRLMRNAVHWCLRREGASGAASVSSEAR